MSKPEASVLASAFKAAVCDVGRQLHEELAGEGRPMNAADSTLHAAEQGIYDFIDGPVVAMMETFRALKNCPEAHRFESFFNDVHALARSGEPVYQLLAYGQIGDGTPIG